MIPKSLSEGFKSFIQKERVIYQETSVDGPFHFTITTDCTLAGDFPRRVSIGDILFHTGNTKTLSPVEGIAYHKPENHSILIYVDGALHKFPVKRFEENQDWKGFLERMDSLALHSLDFQKSLLEYFQLFQDSLPKGIVLSPFTKTNSFDFRELVLKDHGKDWDLFVGLLNKLFPTITIYDGIKNKPPISFHHPYGIPEFYIRKFVIGGDFAKSKKEEESYLYLSAETIYHLIRGYFYGIPFTKRHCIVHIMSSGGTISPQKYVYQLANGQSLNFLNQKFKERFKFFSFESSYEQPSFLEFNRKFYFEICTQSDIFLFPKAPRALFEFPCTACMDCNRVCPTYANPFSLMFDNGKNFKEDSCIECGICSVNCPSGIDLNDKIQKTSLSPR